MHDTSLIDHMEIKNPISSKSVANLKSKYRDMIFRFRNCRSALLMKIFPSYHMKNLWILYAVRCLKSKNVFCLALCNYNWFVVRKQLRRQMSTISVFLDILCSFIGRRLGCCQKFRLFLHYLFFNYISFF